MVWSVHFEVYLQLPVTLKVIRIRKVTEFDSFLDFVSLSHEINIPYFNMVYKIYVY